jgi:D-alanine-D-alanine ligase
MGAIAVLMGGTSREHDISMLSGRQVLTAVDDGLPVVIERDGGWRVGDAPAGPFHAVVPRLQTASELAFVALHGPFGEDGRVQSLLEASGIAYTGSGPAASALAMDKIRSKFVYQAAGLPTAPFVAAFARHDVAATVEAAVGCGPEWVVKPAGDGSSFGVSLCSDRDEMARALASLGGREALVERRIRGREFTCAVLDHEDGPHPLPVTELIPGPEHAFFDFEAKYTPGATNEVTPAEIDDALRERIQALAVRAHVVLGCRDVSRTDMMLPEGESMPLLLETNTIPGLTETSLLPQAAAVAGLDFRQLIAHLVERARGRIGLLP